MEGYKLFPDVFILDEHVLNDDDGSQVAVVDRAVLEQIARNNNSRIDRTGDLTPVVIGHTRERQREEAQPEIVGWADNFKVVPFFNTGKYAIQCDMHIKNTPAGSADDLADKFPRRSVELWLKRKEIDPISLLGATTPERDLGPMRRYQRSAEKGIHYSRVYEDKMTDDKDKGMSEAAAQAVNSDPFKHLSEMISQLVQEFRGLTTMIQSAMQEPDGDEGQGGEEAKGDDSHPGEDYEAMFGEQGKDVTGDPARNVDSKKEADPSDKPHRYEDDTHDYEHCDEDDEDSEKYSYGFGSPTNESIPREVEKKKKMSRDSQYEYEYEYEDPLAPMDEVEEIVEELERVKLSRDEARTKLARVEKKYQAELKAKTDELNDLKRKYRRKEAEATVKQLASEGFELDQAELVEELCNLQTEHWEKRVDKVRKFHRQDITAVQHATPKENEISVEVMMDHDARRDIAEIMRTENIPFSEAKLKYQRQKKS